MRAPKRPAAVLDHRPLDTAAIYEVLPSHAPETTRVVGQRHEQVVDAARKQLLLLAKQSLHCRTRFAATTQHPPMSIGPLDSDAVESYCEAG